ncbi:MAG: hypothetical protein K0S37_1933 [Microbacterium sp.]|nr:hypothetical protein [Microbacterium sp.]
MKRKYLWIGLGALVLLALLLSYWFLAVLILALGAIALGVIAIATGSAPYLKSKRAGGIVAGLGALALVVGSAGAVSALPRPVNISEAAPTTQSVEATPSARPSKTPTPTPTPKPVVEVKQVEERSVVPFTSSTVDDGNLAAGTTAVVTAGANGERLVTYRVTYEDGVEISREVASDVISVAPVNEVIANGTYVAPPPPPPAPVDNGCHPSYEGACVPFADDVDCEGGSGNGPAYIQGPLRVVGPDVYDLERDDDGIACDV